MAKALTADEAVKLLIANNHELKTKLEKAHRSEVEAEYRTPKKQLGQGTTLRQRLDALMFKKQLKKSLQELEV